MKANSSGSWADDLVLQHTTVCTACLFLGLAVEDADAECHERVGEVHGLLPFVGDGEVRDGQVGFLRIGR